MIASSFASFSPSRPALYLGNTFWKTDYLQLCCLARSNCKPTIDSVVCRRAACLTVESNGGGERVVRSRRFALVLLCGTVTLAGWCAAKLGGFEWSGLENTATPIWNRGARGATTSSADAARVGVPPAAAMASVAAVATSHLEA